MIGALPNRDTMLDRRELESRNIIGESFRVRVSPAWRHRGISPIDLGPKAPPPVSEAEIARRRDVIVDAVSQACVEHRSAWGLIPFRTDLPVDPFRYPPQRREYPNGCLVVFYGHDRYGALFELMLSVARPLEGDGGRSASRAFQEAIDAAVPP